MKKLCRACGGRNTRTRDTMLTHDGDKLRWFHCADCGLNWGTIEVDLPEKVTPFMLSTMRKYQNRMAMRAKRGYQGGIGGGPLKPEPKIDVTVRVRAA